MTMTSCGERSGGGIMNHSQLIVLVFHTICVMDVDLLHMTRTAWSSLNFAKLCWRAFSVAKWRSIKQSLRHGAARRDAHGM